VHDNKIDIIVRYGDQCKQNCEMKMKDVENIKEEPFYVKPID
jgi:hypothetical protein